MLSRSTCPERDTTLLFQAYCKEMKDIFLNDLKNIFDAEYFIDIFDICTDVSVPIFVFVSVFLLKHEIPKGWGLFNSVRTFSAEHKHQMVI